MKRPSVLMACLLLEVAMLGAPARAWAAEPLSETVLDVAHGLGFESKDLEKLRRGEIVSRALGHESEKELAAAIAMLVKRPFADVYESVRGGGVLELDRTIVAAHDFQGTPSEATFRALALPQDEIEKLRDVEPGSGFNLSGREIAALSAAASKGDEALVRAYRRALVGRVQAYREGGIGAIAPYARRAGQAAPAEELREAIEKLSRVERRAPAFYRALAHFPRNAAPGIDHQFRWQVITAENRPTVVLSHRAFQLHDDYGVMAERQFYVGRSYNSLQILAGAFPVGEHTLVFYSNRTYTDQVAGFGGRTRRGIGRRMMIGQVAGFWETLRPTLETGGAP